MKYDGSNLNAIRPTAAIAVGLALLVSASSFTLLVRGEDATTRVADEHSDDEAAIKASFADLANSDSALRAEALVRLMSLKAEDLPTLKKVVEASRPLLPAQACVLRQIVTQVFLSGEHYEGNPAAGFLGIRMELTAVTFREAAAEDARVATAGVVIVERMPGFAGARTLRDGDVILSILDRPDAPVRELQDFATVVREMGAGATVHFMILRQGQVIRVAVKLDPRPLEADGFGMTDLLDRRRARAEEYWATHFASVVKESVS